MAPRKRTTNPELPPRVYQQRSGSYSYYPRTGGSVKIAERNAPLHEIWTAYRGMLIADDSRTLRYFADRYYESNNFRVLSDRSKKDWRECEKRPLIYFADLDCRRMTPNLINKYLRLRFEKAKRRANLELTWFRNVFANACAEGLHPGPNPCADIKPMRLSREERKAARSKKRLVSDEDYQAMYDAVPMVGKVAMEIAYTTGIRPGDLFKLHRGDIDGDGIEIEENKTGHEYSKLISPRLAAALRDAQQLPGQPFGGWIVRNNKGDAYTVSGWHANWKRWSRRIPEHQRFTFQEIRIKAISEAKGNKQEFSMHSNLKMLGIYDQSARLSPSN